MKGSRRGKWARRSRGEWRSLLEKFGNGGLGVAAFCRHEGISAASFYRWRSLLSDTVDRDDVVVHGGTPAFVDLGALNSQPAPRARLELKLDFGEGLVLQLVRS